MARKPTENNIDVSLESASGVRYVFAAIVFAMMLLPFIGMAWAQSDATVENRELAEPPVILTEDGLFNTDFLTDAGNYFNDHYAYRVQAIDAGAHLYAGLFGISTAKTVVVGTDGWLYYAGTLGDYQDTKPLREGEARNIAHNMRMMQDYCEEHGASFSFTVAPNKNHIYGKNMPYYYPEVSSQNMGMLQEQLKAFDVNTADVYTPIAESEDREYFLRDSHWTEKGALIAQDAIAKSAGFKTLGIKASDFFVRDDYTGDLASMLYPDSPEPEDNWYIAGVNDGSGQSASQRSGSFWNYVEGESVEDSTIVTEATGNMKAADASADGTEGQSSSKKLAQKVKQVSENNGKLLMYRDSFGFSLIPYLACEFESATFSRLVPFNLLLVEEEEPDTVLVERAQRHVDYIAEEAPLMICPMVELEGDVEDASSDFKATCETSVNGPLACLKGFVDGDVYDKDSDEILVRLIDPEGASNTYKAFALSDDESGNDNGYCVNAEFDLWADQDVTAEVIVKSGKQQKLLGSFDVRFEE